MSNQGHSVIERFIDGQPIDIQAEFRAYAQNNRSDPSQIHSWLSERGCKTHLTTVLRWVDRHLPPGERAAVVNADTADYTGVKLIPLMEKTLVMKFRIFEQMCEQLEGYTVDPDKAIEVLPHFVREIRGICEQIAEIQKQQDYRAVSLNAIARFVEIVMNASTIRDKAHESMILRTMEQAALQIREEIDRNN